MKSLGTGMFLGGFSAAASARAPRAHRDPSPRFARCSLHAREQHRCSPGWAGTYLLAPFSSPINLEVFLYGSQAPTRSLFQGILEAGRQGTLAVPLLRGERCLGSVTPRAAWRGWLRDAGSQTRRCSDIRRSRREQITAQARAVVLQQSLPWERGYWRSSWVRERSYTNSAVKHRCRAGT